MVIPRLTERVDCMLYRRRLELEIAEVKPDVDMVRNAGSELRSSVKFKQVLTVSPKAIYATPLLITGSQAVLMIGNTLNGSTFRGGARGFRLDALMKVRFIDSGNERNSYPCAVERNEDSQRWTRLSNLTSLPGSGTHAIGPLIDPLLGGSASRRGSCSRYCIHLTRCLVLILPLVSVQIILQTIHGLMQGLDRVAEEVTIVKSSPKQTTDLFVHVMEPFIAQARPVVDNLNISGQALDSELKSLMEYYGESTEGSDATKPEDFFGITISFSSALRKAAMEMHDVEAKLIAVTPASPTIVVPPTPTEPEQHFDTLKGRSPARPEINGTPSSQSLQPPANRDRTSGRSTVGRGDLDQAIRSIREGQRRARPSRPLSRIFLDGANDQVDRRASRVFDFPAS